jgi:3-oxoacyl-[acyl-carrier-protein] synthase II
MTAFTAAVTGIGLVTPAGVGVTENWNRILAADPAARNDTALAGLPIEISCRVPDFRFTEDDVAHPWQWDRFSQFALIAVREALRDAGLVPKQWDDESRVAVIIGSGAGGTATMEEQHAQLLAEGPDGVSALTLPMGLINMAAGQVAIAIGARGPCHAPVSACASGASAIAIGKDLLSNGAADIVIVGGTEAPITRFYVSAFARMRALSRRPEAKTASRPFDATRDGFVIGEGAGIFVMETEEHAHRRGARIRARLLGCGASADANHVTSPHPKGLGARYAMLAALRDAGLAPDAVGYVNAHGTSTPGNDVVESLAIDGVFGSRIAVSSTKGVTGHLLGAAGAIEAAFTALAIEHGALPATANLTTPDPKIAVDLVYGAARQTDIRVGISNSFGFGGQNVSLIIGA